MTILEHIIRSYAPHTCLRCGNDGAVLCKSCQNSLPQPVSCCYRCQRLTDNGATCTTCRRHTALRRVQAATRYQDDGEQLVRLLKYSGLRAAVSDMAGAIAERVAFPSSASVLLVPVPTASSRVRQRGYDQAVLLAKALARQADFPYASLLLRSGQQRQVGASRRQREAQLASAFVVRRAKKIEGARVILVDDVKTTGATLEAAALALKQAGAKSVEAAVFAQA